MILAGEIEVLREKPVPALLSPPKIPHRLAWDWTWASRGE
jgi:hypothetical protein